jgi:uncharacterized membrane protein
MRGLAALLPTMITLYLLVWAWNFLWNSVGQYMIDLVKAVWWQISLRNGGFPPTGYIEAYWDPNSPVTGMRTHMVGMGMAILLVYFVGIFVGNLIGRTAWRLIEKAVMRIPLVRAIYPAVKQVTDFVMSERSEQFAGSRVVAVQPHAQGIWSIGLVTGSGQWPTGGEGKNQDMVTVFVPSSPTAFSGYVLVVPRNSVVELPLSVEEAMRLLISGGVIAPRAKGPPDLEPGGKAAHPASPSLPQPAVHTSQEVSREVHTI